MGNAQIEQKRAVEAGYWHLYRFDPRKDTPFSLDSKAPAASLRDFLTSEVRYSSLMRSFPERAEALFEQAEKQAAARYEQLVRLGEIYGKK
ncbi:MAG TPA: hypothetical protein PLG48_06570, partial [Candidatus Avimonas sp.]|nr:hypothetical protein [Candidatus Avimonas sp.]